MMNYTRPYGRFVRVVEKRVQLHSSTEVAAYVQKNIYDEVFECMQEKMWAPLFNCRHQLTH